MCDKIIEESKDKFKLKGKWKIENLSITMRTPGNDEDLISGFLFNERIVEDINDIQNIKKMGNKVEMWCRKNGLGVIHGGINALRFTPHFAITSEEIDMIVEIVRSAVIKFSEMKSIELASSTV